MRKSRVASEFMTLKEVADYMHLSRQTVRAYVQGQSLPATQIVSGSAWRIKKSALDAWIAEHTRAGDDYLLNPKGAAR